MNVTKMVAVAGVLVALAMPVRAEPGPIGNWLMNEPVTLWDWGMMRMEQAANNAASFAASDDGNGGIWVTYDWDNNEIEIGLAVFNVSHTLTHELCNETRRAFIADIVGATPDLIERQEGAVRLGLHLLIGQWFSHHGFQRGSPDEELAEKLARIIFVSAKLIGDGSSIECRERIMTFNAPSKPLG